MRLGEMILNIALGAMIVIALWKIIDLIIFIVGR